jgi:hypothetical protein
LTQCFDLKYVKVLKTLQSQLNSKINDSKLEKTLQQKEIERLKSDLNETLDRNARTKREELEGLEKQMKVNFYLCSFIKSDILFSRKKLKEKAI